MRSDKVSQIAARMNSVRERKCQISNLLTPAFGCRFSTVRFNFKFRFITPDNPTNCYVWRDSGSLQARSNVCQDFWIPLKSFAIQPPLLLRARLYLKIQFFNRRERQVNRYRCAYVIFKLIGVLFKYLAIMRVR